jgi:hypothetical protein
MKTIVRKIFDIGYGQTTKASFIERLKAAFPEVSAVIVDIRKEGSGSRNGRWANWGENMEATCEEAGHSYITFPGLSNPYGGTQKGLWEYEQSINYGKRREHMDVLTYTIVENPQMPYCLLCSERKPYKGEPHTIIAPGRTTIGSWSTSCKDNCHRVIVARNFTGRAWFDHEEVWEVIHLYDKATGR